MQLGDIANGQAAPYGKPLDGVRILAAEQMQALPFATQLLGRLGAEVVKLDRIIKRKFNETTSDLDLFCIALRKKP